MKYLIVTSQRGWLYVGGKAGRDIGVQLTERMIRSASKKFRNKAAAKRSCRNNFWNSSTKWRKKNQRANTKEGPNKDLQMSSPLHWSAITPKNFTLEFIFPFKDEIEIVEDKYVKFIPGGRTFQAIVSVIEVKIQFNSPSGDFRSLSCPGIRSIIDMSTSLRSRFRNMNEWRAIRIGVVKQDVNRSAGRVEFVGSVSFGPQDTRTMFSLVICSWRGSSVEVEEDPSPLFLCNTLHTVSRKWSQSDRLRESILQGPPSDTIRGSISDEMHGYKEYSKLVHWKRVH